MALTSLHVNQVPHIKSLLNIARHHHERWHGNGYRDGLRGEAVPHEAHIIKVADVFDALTGKRAYKEAWPVEEAARSMREGAGTQFDPQLVAILLSQAQEIHAIMKRFAYESFQVASGPFEPSPSLVLVPRRPPPLVAQHPLPAAAEMSAQGFQQVSDLTRARRISAARAPKRTCVTFSAASRVEASSRRRDRPKARP